MSVPLKARDPLIGSRLDGRYLVVSQLGRGGMGVVYSGVHEQLGRPVAIKVLSASIADDPQNVERFLREARAASSLTHGNVVDVSDLGTLPDGRPYLVMPKFEGRDLYTVLGQDGPLKPARVVELLRGAAAALDVIHAKGYVHRDVKPENLMLVVHEDGSESVRLLDFGIVALLSQQGSRLTAKGVVFGTPEYLAPELMEHDVPDPRTDVYSLAAVAFELMTGRAPFEADSPMRLMQLKMSRDAPRMSAVAPNLSFSDSIERVVQRGLSRNPARRYGTAGEFVRALEQAVEGREVAPLLPASAPTPTRVLRRKQLLIAAGVGPLVGTAIAWGLTSFGSKEPPRAIETQPAEVVHKAPQPHVTPLPARPEAEPSTGDARSARAESPETAEQATAPIEDAERAVAGEQADEAQGAPSEQASATKGSTRARTRAASEEPARPVAAPTPEVQASSEARKVSAETLLKAAAQALIQGRLERADQLYTEATQAEPRNAAAWRGLGLTSERLGRRAAAANAFRRALALEPNGAQADSTRERLRKLEEGS